VIHVFSLSEVQGDSG